MMTINAMTDARNEVILDDQRRENTPRRSMVTNYFNPEISKFSC